MELVTTFLEVLVQKNSIDYLKVIVFRTKLYNTFIRSNVTTRFFGFKLLRSATMENLASVIPAHEPAQKALVCLCIWVYIL